MQLIITSESSFRSIQQDFSVLYPFLGIELPPTCGKANCVGARCKLAVLNTVSINVPPEITVSELELSFQQTFDLKIKILRKAGSAWVKTQHTEHWTLHHQNEEGSLFSCRDNEPD